MAEVKLSDIIDVTVFADLPPENDPTLAAIVSSGIMVTNPVIQARANAPGKLTELPQWGDLDPTSEPNVSTDDPTTLGVPAKISQKDQKARKAMLNKGWSETDLAAELAMGGRAMNRIRSRVDNYWNLQLQKRLLSTAMGVMNDNVANDSGDMVEDISIADGDAATAANLFSRAAMVNAAFTLGDRFKDTVAIAVHSVVYKRMVDNDDIDFIKDSTGTMLIPTFMGRVVIVDDGVPVVAGGTSGFKYHSILFGGGAFGFGAGTPATPVEIDRSAAGGNGAGVETLWTRKTWILHPAGFQWTDTTVAGASATRAELELAANWDRVANRKNVPLAYLITNG